MATSFQGTMAKYIACDKMVCLVDKLTADNRVYHKVYFRGCGKMVCLVDKLNTDNRVYHKVYSRCHHCKYFRCRHCKGTLKSRVYTDLDLHCLTVWCILPLAALLYNIGSSNICSSSLDVDEGGLTALVRLGNGAMRKALNILQPMRMASQQITEEAVYLCTGNPMPKDIEQIALFLLNESFSTNYRYISDMKMRKGLALVDIIREVTVFVCSNYRCHPMSAK